MRTNKRAPVNVGLILLLIVLIGVISGVFLGSSHSWKATESSTMQSSGVPDESEEYGSRVESRSSKLAIPPKVSMLRPGVPHPVEPLNSPATASLPPTASARTAISDAEVAEKATASLSEVHYGQIAYNTPPAMNIEDTAPVELKLSLDASINELTKLIESEGVKAGARIRVSEVMEAQLHGDFFHTTAVTPSQCLTSIRFAG